MNANVLGVKEPFPRQTVLIVDDTPQNIKVLGALVHPTARCRSPS